MEKLKIGVFGVRRGIAYIDQFMSFEDTTVYAICDKAEDALDEAIKHCNKDVKVFRNFDEFIDCGLDAVVLTNYFYEHTKYAIICLKKGIPCLSETTACGTMAECVSLCRTVEETGTLYFFAENYPHMKGVEELKRQFDKGTFGEVHFAEGEYVHPMSVGLSNAYAPEKWHWRKFLPKTYYSTHSLAPLMYITGRMPKRVIGKTKFDPGYAEERHRYSGDCCGIMLVEMDDGSIFRIAGSCSFAPHGNWYRVGCINGALETVRGDESRVRVIYNPWCIPEGEQEYSEYYPQWQSNAEMAEKANHGGGDFWVCYNFVRCIKGEAKPVFDCYKAAAMSAVAILGWYSVLDDSKQYDIPDFKDEAQRKKYENDDRSPFPEEGKPETLPYNSRPWTPPYPIE